MSLLQSVRIANITKNLIQYQYGKITKFLSNCMMTRLENRVQHINFRQIHSTVPVHTFWEREKRAGYNKPLNNISRKQLILDGLKELKGEILMWKNEITEKLKSDPILVFRPGETDVVWDFVAETEFGKWITTSDSDHNEGLSHCTLERSPAGYGLFSGNVQSKVPLDGRIKRSGYCNIKTIRARKSFKRESYLDWTGYNMLVLKIRGDGRSYLLNIACEGSFDIWWNDVFHYALYTRGGPHWQIVKIPFSKFFLASKGRIQDRQSPIPLYLVSNFGISVSSKGGQDGPFRLEIDYIGLEFDPSHRETFAYEMYKTPKYVVAT